MKSYRKRFARFLAVLVSLALFFPCFAGHLTLVGAEGENVITAETSAEINQGETGWCYVYINSLAGISSLDVSVHFDPAKVSVQNTYNLVSNTVYDFSVQDDYIHYTYVFDGTGGENKTALFYFWYSAKADAEIGKTFFDITVSDAYDSALNPVEISGSRTSFTILEKKTTKTCYVYGTSNAASSVGKEFEFTYSLSTKQIASGAFAIRYDHELFELVSVTTGSFMNDKITDVNTSLTGAVYCSFASESYGSYADLITVRFRTLKNVATSSAITLEFSDLYDLDFCQFICQGCSGTVNVAFDETYLEDAPCLRLSSEYDKKNDQYALYVKLDADSHLGAGDFVITFDTDYLSYVSAEKLLKPTFFNVNDKKIEDGILKFSIISMDDIVSEADVLKLVFDRLPLADGVETTFGLSGSGTTDSMTQPIRLNFIDSAITFPEKHIPSSAVEENLIDPTCTEDGSFDSVVYCSICHKELSRTKETITKLGHNFTNYVSDNNATCTEDGTKTAHCDHAGCQETDTVIDVGSKLGHSYGTVQYTWVGDQCTAKRVCSHDGTHIETETVTGIYVKDTDATCEANEKGHYEATFANPAFAKQSTAKNSVEVPETKIGHSFTNYVSDNNATCTADGTKTAHCDHAGCDATDTIADVGSKLGHNYDKPTYKWNGDKCTATMVCLNDSRHEETETATAKYVKDTNATCTENEKGHYEVTFQNGAFEKQTTAKNSVEKQGTKLGHNYVSVVTPPTKTERGYTTHTCSRCHHSYVDSYTDPIAPSHSKGDVTGDNIIDAFDYQMLKAYVLGTYTDVTPEQKQAMDINGDNRIDAFDYQMVKAHVLGTYVIQ